MKLEPTKIWIGGPYQNSPFPLCQKQNNDQTSKSEGTWGGLHFGTSLEHEVTWENAE